jgi:hypothetical protein
VRIKHTALAALGTAALALPAAAIASNGHGQAGDHGHKGHANGHSKSHTVTYVFKGTYDGSGLVSVNHGNGHARKADLVGQDVQFDLTNAKLSVADTNADQVIDANDLVTGDSVLVQARLPKGDPGSQPFAARMVVDQTNPTEDTSDDGDTGDGGDAG